MIASALPTVATTASDAGMASMNGGASSDTSAFASLFAAMLNGEAMPAEAQKLPLLGLWTTTAVEKLLSGEASEATDEAVAWDAVLEQLSALFAALPIETQQRLAAEPKMQEWMAMAEAELTMSKDGSAELEETMPTHAKAGEPSADEAQRFVGIMERLAAALKANPQSAYLPAAAEQAVKLIATAVSPLLNGDSTATGTLAALTAASSKHDASEKGAPWRSNATEQTAALLEKAKAVVVKPAETNAEAGRAAVRVSHLAALEAKASFLRIATTDASAAKAAADGGAANVSDNADGPAPSTANGVDWLKSATTTETIAKAETVPQRIPLPNAAEHLNGWILKQASGGGNFKTETTIRLMPEHLGQVEVRLSMQNGQLTATIVTESAMAKDALESNLAALRANLQTQGVTVERLVVSHNQTNGFQSGMFQEERGRQSQGRESDRDQRSRKDDGAEEWSEVLAVTGEQELAALAETQGSSFQAQA